MKNVVGLFDSIRDAEAVVRDLRTVGVAEADISFAGRSADDATMQANEYIADGNSEAAEGAGFGATGGAVVGGLTGLLVGLGVLAIPGIGPVLAGGTLAAALGSAVVGAGLGAAAGGLLGALVGAGIPEEEAHVYAEGIRRGGALVMAKVDDSLVDRALDIMERHNAVDIDERSRMYRESGWAGYDESMGPYTGETTTASSTARADYAATDSAYDATRRARDAGDTYTTANYESSDTTGYSAANQEYRGDVDTEGVPGQDEWERSSKAGTAGGTLAGAATGAALGAAGGPVGAVVGGVAGAVTGGAVGAAGDAAGAEASEASHGADNTTTAMGSVDTLSETHGTAYTGTTGESYAPLDRDVMDTAGYDPSSPYAPADRANDSLVDSSERETGELDRDDDTSGARRTGF